jgi:hypothetical protein
LQSSEFLSITVDFHRFWLQNRCNFTVISKLRLKKIFFVDKNWVFQPFLIKTPSFVSFYPILNCHTILSYAYKSGNNRHDYSLIYSRKIFFCCLFLLLMIQMYAKSERLRLIVHSRGWVAANKKLGTLDPGRRGRRLLVLQM